MERNEVGLRRLLSAVLPSVVVLTVACGSTQPPTLQAPISSSEPAAPFSSQPPTPTVPPQSAGTEEIDLTPTRESAVSRRLHMPGAERANLVGRPLEYASIPVMAPVARCRARAEGTSSASCTSKAFEFHTIKVQPVCAPGQRGYEREEWTFSGIGLDRSMSPRSVVRVGGKAIPLQPLVAGHFDDPALDLRNLSGRWDTTFVWTTADLSGAGAKVRVAETEGEFVETAPGSVAFKGTAQLESEVDAVPLVEGEVYVYRACAEGCMAPLGDPKHVERIAIVAPPAGWVGATDVDAESSLGDEQPFTQIAAKVKVGSSASMIVNYPARHPTKHERFGPPAVVTSTVMVDVVWLEGDAPEVTLYVGSFDTAVGVLESRQKPAARLPGDECYTPQVPRPLHGVYEERPSDDPLSPFK